MRQFLSQFYFLRVYLSPFKFFWPRLYFGKIAIGTPYFLPRRWVKDKEKTGFLNPVPKRIGFDFVCLGYKTKWDDLDYRFEWNPVWSFVFFGIQIALIFRPIHEDQYWTCWLVYDKHTDKSKSVKDRVLEAREKFPCVWNKYDGDNKQSICYWDLILKNKPIK